ncbi:hypothetical protein D5R81_16825 [Parashewanella spongiae]|uniref:Uncharacterized protein n=1 Tax=Parashewanella spongiae TaxID=342950 RepID=A0A3A6TIT3_9GAMM|nr:hypothetical protein [Parashewanella spongiae]MCL1079713.1 hypothetical protein [Parashewanella spongiae]RJY07025.1 hypothetical protein D5R81_16825 [Parashewanella spongiae]
MAVSTNTLIQLTDLYNWTKSEDNLEKLSKDDFKIIKSSVKIDQGWHQLEIKTRHTDYAIYKFDLKKYQIKHVTNPRRSNGSEFKVQHIKTWEQALAKIGLRGHLSRRLESQLNETHNSSNE